MLHSFTVSRRFNKLQVWLFAEPHYGPPEASVRIVYDSRIKRMGPISRADINRVLTVEGAEAWLSEVVGEHGSRVETWEHEFRSKAVA